MTKLIKNQKNTLLLSLAVAGLSIILAFSISLVLAWTEPGSSPPEGNVPAPLNVGSGAQIKSGDLTVGDNSGTDLTVQENLKVNGDIVLENDRDIYGADMIQGYNDLRLFGNEAGTATIYLDGPASVTGDLTVDGNATVAGQNVCRQNGTNCPSFGTDCASCDPRFINASGDDSMTGNLTVGSGGAGYVYLGSRGYYIGDDLGGSDVQTNAPNFYVYDGGWKRLCREGDGGACGGAGVGACADCDSRFVNATGDTINGNLTVTGKITVNEIDPVYKIDGIGYATYGHSTVGLNEEVVGKAELSQISNDKIYGYVIDFANQAEGNDLWFFARITDFGQNWEDLVVNLTPEGKAQVWYELKPQENKLVFYGDEEIAVSYRLIAPRFDWPERNTNLAPDQGVEGMKVE